MSLSSLALESDDECEIDRISIGIAPAILCAVWTCTFDVETNAVGDEIWFRYTGLPALCVAARPTYIGSTTAGLSCRVEKEKARANDIVVAMLSNLQLSAAVEEWIDSL